MTLHTAKEHFEAALAIAEQENDVFRREIAEGLIHLVAEVQLRSSQIKTELGAIKNKVS